MDALNGRREWRDMLARVIRHAAKLRGNWRVERGRKEIGPQLSARDSTDGLPDDCE